MNKMTHLIQPERSRSVISPEGRENGNGGGPSSSKETDRPREYAGSGIPQAQCAGMRQRVSFSNTESGNVSLPTLARREPGAAVQGAMGSRL